MTAHSLPSSSRIVSCRLALIGFNKDARQSAMLIRFILSDDTMDSGGGDQAYGMVEVVRAGASQESRMMGNGG